MAFLQKGSLDKYFTYYGIPGLLSRMPHAMCGFMVPLVVLPLGAMAVNSAVENGTVRVLLSKPLRRRDFFAGSFLGDSLALFLGTALYASFIATYSVHIGAPVSKTFELTIVFGALLYFSLLQYLALGYLLSTLSKGKVSLLTALFLAFLLDFAVPLLIVTSWRDNLFSVAHYIPSPSLQNMVISMAVAPNRGLPPKSVGEVLNLPGNLAMLLLPTLLYLALSWLRFRKADLR